VALPAAALGRRAGAYALPSGATVAVGVADDGRGLVLVPEGQAAYDALFGAAPAPARDALAALAARTDSVVRASLAGDWAPFRAALSLDAPTEAVARREGGARARVAADLGAPNGWRVVGVIPAPDGGDVVVRFDHGGGAYYERYGWRGGSVALFARGRAAPSLTVLPTGADTFAWYDIARGTLLTARFAGDRLRLETPAGVLEAVRVGR
jgi:hypothetical protein